MVIKTSEEDKERYREMYPDSKIVIVQQPQQKSHCCRNACLCIALIIFLILFGPIIALLVGVIGLGVLCACCASS